MSDVSSIHPDSSHSVSTDTEESFLIRQINKSQLFNQSNSSSSGSSSSKKQRRSFFRESYIDESGQNKSFSVFHDVINETSDESRDVDLSGLSSLDLKLVGNNVLGELDGNKTVSRSNSTKDSAIQRQKSLKKNDSKRLSGKSTISNEFVVPNTSYLSSHNVSSHNVSSQNISSQNLSSLSDLSSFQQKLNNNNQSFENNQAMRIPTPDRLAPNPPQTQQTLTHSPNSNVKSQYNHDLRPFSTDSQREADDERIQIYTAYGNHHSQQFQRPPSAIAPTPVTIPSIRTNNHSRPSSQKSFQSIKQPTKQTSQSTLSSSYKSVDSTKKSILEYELTRKKSPGLPNLLINSPNLNSPNLSGSDSQSSDGEVKIQNVHNVARRGLGFSIVGVVPSVHSPVSSTEINSGGPETDDMNIQKSSERLKDLELQRLKFQQEKMFSKTKSSHFDLDKEAIGFNDDHSKSSSGSEDYNDYFHDDEVLQKIRRYRNERPYDSINQSRRADSTAWIIFLISFLLPPLFFFLGFGILDQFIGRINPHIKKLSLITGFLVLLISLACIGIGFGVGLSSLS